VEIFTKNQCSFVDFDAFAESINQADLEHAQIDTGKFNGLLTQVAYGPVIVSTHKMNRTILQEGAGIKGYTTFLMIGRNSNEFSWRRSRLGRNRIGILKSGMEHSCITPINFLGTPVSILNDYLFNLANVLGYPDFEKHINTSESFILSDHRAAHMQELIGDITECQYLDKSMIMYELPQLIISSIEKQFENSIRFDTNYQNVVIHKAKDYIFDRMDDTIQILDLCKEVGVSERHLRYLFKEKIGISPMKFVKRVKLNRARKLIKSNNQRQSIIEFAHQLGFWHSGQFANDYKSLFGELPSETFKNR